MSAPQPVVEEVAEQEAMQVTNTVLNFEAFGESADKESSSETENFQNTLTAKPDAAVTVDEVEVQPVDLELGDSESENEEAHLLSFVDSLLSCLSRKKSERIRKSGKIQEMEDFVSLILKKEGNWTSKKFKSKPQHVFEDTEGKFIINRWTSSKTLNVQGDQAEDIEEKLDRLLVKARNSQSELVDGILEPPKPKKTKQAKKGANVEDTDTGMGKELKAIWNGINEFKTAISCLVKAKANTNRKKI